MHKKYKKNFLSEVIAQAEFLTPVDELKQSIPDSIFQAAREFFPVPEPKLEEYHELNITNDDVKQSKVKSMKWLFHNNDRSKTLTVTNQSFTIKHKKHEEFEDLNNEFLKVLDAISK